MTKSLPLKCPFVTCRTITIESLEKHLVEYHTEVMLASKLAYMIYRIHKAFHELETAPIEKAVPLSVIEAKIKFHEEELVMEMNLGQNQSEIVTSQLVARLGVLKGLAKEAKEAEPMSGTIQTLKSILDHEYYK